MVKYIGESMNDDYIYIVNKVAALLSEKFKEDGSLKTIVRDGDIYMISGELNVNDCNFILEDDTIKAFCNIIRKNDLIILVREK